MSSKPTGGVVALVLLGVALHMVPSLAAEAPAANPHSAGAQAADAQAKRPSPLSTPAAFNRRRCSPQSTRS